MVDGDWVVSVRGFVESDSIFGRMILICVVCY